MLSGESRAVGNAHDTSIGALLSTVIPDRSEDGICRVS
jgi:hypothetical protein